MSTACPVCDQPLGSTLLEVAAVPALANALWPDPDAARSAPRGDIDLRLCSSCGLLTNVAFDPELVAYAPGYENSLHFSSTFSKYAESLARRLVDSYTVRDTDVVEIGCGSGEFLTSLCELGGNRGIGYDPSYDGPAEVIAGEGSARFVRAPYPDDGTASSAALVCCRHVLEHQIRPAELLDRLASALDGGATVAYFEVPDARYMLEHAAVWDVIYEHPQYFSADALVELCQLAGFEPLQMGATYGAQFLALDTRWPASASATRRAHGPSSKWTTSATLFGAQFAATVDSWQARLGELLGAGERVALWGAGSKGISFLNLVPAAAEIEWVVDVSPRKRGLHVPGTAHRISAPDDLGGAELDAIVVLNPLYEAEIRNQLADLEVDARTIVA